MIRSESSTQQLLATVFHPDDPSVTLSVAELVSLVRKVEQEGNVEILPPNALQEFGGSDDPDDHRRVSREVMVPREDLEKIFMDLLRRMPSLAFEFPQPAEDREADNSNMRPGRSVENGNPRTGLEPDFGPACEQRIHEGRPTSPPRKQNPFHRVPGDHLQTGSIESRGPSSLDFKVQSQRHLPRFHRPGTLQEQFSQGNMAINGVRKTQSQANNQSVMNHISSDHQARSTTKTTTTTTDARSNARPFASSACPSFSLVNHPSFSESSRTPYRQKKALRVNLECIPEQPDSSSYASTSAYSTTDQESQAMSRHFDLEERHAAERDEEVSERNLIMERALLAEDKVAKLEVERARLQQTLLRSEWRVKELEEERRAWQKSNRQHLKILHMIEQKLLEVALSRNKFQARCERLEARLGQSASSSPGEAHPTLPSPPSTLMSAPGKQRRNRRFCRSQEGLCAEAEGDPSDEQEAFRRTHGAAGCSSKGYLVPHPSPSLRRHTSDDSLDPSPAATLTEHELLSQHHYQMGQLAQSLPPKGLIKPPLASSYTSTRSNAEQGPSAGDLSNYDSASSSMAPISSDACTRTSIMIDGEGGNQEDGRPGWGYDPTLANPTATARKKTLAAESSITRKKRGIAPPIAVGTAWKIHAPYWRVFGNTVAHQWRQVILLLLLLLLAACLLALLWPTLTGQAWKITIPALDIQPEDIWGLCLGNVFCRMEYRSMRWVPH